MKTKFIFFICAFMGYICNAQSIEKFSIDSGGASSKVGGIEILYTIGEVNISERNSSMVEISEGFINGSFSQTLGINNPEVSANQIIIYPNPTSDIININSEVEITKVEMYDIMGKRVFEASYLSKININGFESGLYILKLFVNMASVTKRIIIN